MSCISVVKSTFYSFFFCGFYPPAQFGKVVFNLSDLVDKVIVTSVPPSPSHAQAFVKELVGY